MIRRFKNDDMDQVLDIWLHASVEAHDFLEASFWKSQVELMREKYIPMAETYVYEMDDFVCGFISLYKNTIAAIFVSPDKQSLGLGTQLINHVKSLRNELDLKVYKCNKSSVNFYLKCGFKIIGEQIDEHTGQSELIMTFLAS